MKPLAALLLAALLAGCASAPPTPPAPSDMFSDATFGKPGDHVGAADLFTMTPAMRAYLASAAFHAEIRNKGAEQGLVDALYQKGELKIEYDSAKTRNAAETFEARAGNCLSLVIMTAAFANELGLKVNFQSVLVGDTWRRNGGLYLASNHVNLTLAARPSSTISVGPERSLTVDFLPSETAAALDTRPLDQNAIAAMYMNNRAIEAMVQDQLDNAYWWARAAVTQNPAFISAYNTLAVVYQRHGDWQMAERAYRTALQREPENVVVMRNLAPLLAQMGKTDESQQMLKRAASIEPYPPFHFFNQGMSAMARHDYKAAQALFAREVRRAPYYDEFHFWLGVASLRLGDTARAREHIALAVENSTTSDTRTLYSAKLEHLRAQLPH
ncbi:tetratricopeptide repeat protein [Massilia sp. R2A-15]|uniref:tetratricopeptide repeat protein n=1 Tax=Massilia sp. R2A-15 TaxID=3064278 RepID=UPI0027347420|nr:tetratricopeptide repeat protein [Massilia sp. R2A-15]WLI87442.1 tetratricopeptide repeat protein [Massilia sp. R2A-15]